MKKVFLGGTCAGSRWRDTLIEGLEINYFNPVVSEWNTEAAQLEIKERANCDFCLYVITSNMQGVYSIAEVVDDSHLRPEKVVFCFDDHDGEFDAKMKKSLIAVAEMIERNGGRWCKDLNEVSKFLNNNERHA